MKNRTIDLVLIVLIVGLFVTFFMVDRSNSHNKEAPTSVVPTSAVPQNPIQEAVFPQKIEVTNYSYEGAKIKLGFINTAATKDTLTVTLSITGIDFSNSSYSFTELVCDPYVTTKEQVLKTYKSTEVREGDPMQITYIYTLQGNNFKTLNAELDWTIGPCGTYLNEGQSNATPFPAELMTNYHFTFIVPVK